jgi:hypothetical protein
MKESYVLEEIPYLDRKRLQQAVAERVLIVK